MAVTGVVERWQGRTGGADEKGVRTLNREWLVETNSVADGVPQAIDGVIAADDSADLWASHPDWAWAIRGKITAEPFGGPLQWLVKAAYSTEPFPASGDGSGTGDNSASPDKKQSNDTPADQRPPTISITRKEVTEPLEYDAVAVDGDGNPTPILNAVGERFNPPPEVFRSRHLITFKFFRSPGDLLWTSREKFMDSVNLTSFAVFDKVYAAGQLRVIDYGVETVWETGDHGLKLFMALTVQVESNPKGWKVKVLDTGRRQKVGVDPDITIKPITDSQGNPVADPVPLDFRGHKIDPLDPDPLWHYVEADGYVPQEWNGDSGLLM